MQNGYLVGVCVIVFHEGKVLISERLAGAADGVGKSACPGGALELTDDGVIAGAARELLEETGLVLQRGVLTNYVEEGFRVSDGRRYVTLFVVAGVDSVASLANTEPHKHADWRWVAPADLPGNMWSRAAVQAATAYLPNGLC